jgi:serine/threonine-protein kinase
MLEREGACLACLLSGGLDESEKEPLPSNSLVFGDFEIEQQDDGSFWELGRGAMGVTYRARDKMLHRPVALKVIEVPTKAKGARAMRDRFLREARAAAALRHANVASVFQFGAPTETGRCYYAMELVEGETLATLVRRDGPLPVEAALEIAIQVTRALVAAAAHGLIHRDLKPANIMLAPNDATPAALEAKVIDFGLAKATAAAADEMDITHGAFVGTPTFASPEQFAGNAADARSDIYSLGVTLWYALTGEVPYPGKTIEEIRSSQKEAALPVQQLSARKVPTPLIKLLRHTLAISPAERTQSARALLGALELCRAKMAAAPRRRRAALLYGLLVIGAVGLTSYLRHRPPAPVIPPEKSIAVLPFENRSADQASAYFADGIQDEILERLARVADLKVIAPTSTEKYRGRPANLKTVAADLGVRAVLKGSVQRTGDKVRVAVQLIEARSDRELWAASYDRPLADVFAVQSEIASAVANALHARLTPQESLAVKRVTTSNQKAYNLFLRAEHCFRVARENLSWDPREAIELYRQAVAEDPRFALAYARLSIAESYLRLIGGTADQERINAEKALALQPDLMQAHLALAYCDIRDRRDYPSALEHLARAQALAPQNAEVLQALGVVYRYQLRYDEAIAAYERAAQYDPGNSKLFFDLATICLWTGRNDKVQAPLERSLALNPTNEGAAAVLGQFLFMQRGDVEGARRVMHGRGPGAQIALADTYRETRDYEEAIRLTEELPPENSAAFNPYDGFKDEQLGLLLHSAGHDERARPLLEPARDRRIALLADKTRSAAALWIDSMSLARIELALGNRDAAVQVAESGALSDAVIRDTINREYYRAFLAEIYAGAGCKDEALVLISEFLNARSGFAGITPFMLRLAPIWDPLRDDPRFQALLKEYPAEVRVR